MNTFALKVLALALMVVDHIGYYFPGAPIWLRWLGRASFPLFLFCMVWGYHYTKSRKKYLLRLYAMSVFMVVLTIVVNIYLPSEMGYGDHNIFVTMLWVGVLISAVELLQTQRKEGILLLGGIFAVQVLYYVLPLKDMVRGDILTGIIPNLHLNEYGFEFVALGVLMYFLRENKAAFTAVYLIFCINQFSVEMLNNSMMCQWLMVLALPCMLYYNRQRGPGMKYFFYLFYPAHTILLYYLADFAL